MLSVACLQLPQWNLDEGVKDTTELEKANFKTLEALENCVLEKPMTDEVRAHILHCWIFPLWPLDLRIFPTDKKGRMHEKTRLREFQKSIWNRSIGDI